MKFTEDISSMMNQDLKIEFKAHPLLPGGHLQTITGYYLPNHIDLGNTKLHQVQTVDGDHLVICENKAKGHPSFKRVVLLMHGLGGEASSPYMLRLATLFRFRGWIPFRMNLRGCGEGRGLARNIYHSGKSEDISSVLASISQLHPETPIIAVGFSLSGNMLLKLLGEGIHPIADSLVGAIAVSPPLELSLCSHALHFKQNWIYEFRFVRLLKQAIRERAVDFADYPNINIPKFLSLRTFDELCTAPLSGFSSAEDYYTKASSKPFLGHIAIPTFLLASDDDPFIPKQTYRDLPQNGKLQVTITRGGGHMGFVSAEKTPLGNHRWMDYAVLNFSERLLEEKTDKVHSDVDG